MARLGSVLCDLAAALLAGGTLAVRPHKAAKMHRLPVPLTQRRRRIPAVRRRAAALRRRGRAVERRHDAALASDLRRRKSAGRNLAGWRGLYCWQRSLPPDARAPDKDSTSSRGRGNGENNTLLDSSAKVCLSAVARRLAIPSGYAA